MVRSRTFRAEEKKPRNVCTCSPSGYIRHTGCRKGITHSGAWQGSGTLFEIGGGLERLVIPDLGAAGPSPTLSGEAVTSNTFTEVGSGTLTVSEEAATAEFNIYPFESRITLTVSGGTSQEYPDEYIEVRPNEETLNGTLDESRTYDYSFYTGGFEEFDFGTVAVRQGAGFSDTDGVTFDSTDTNVNSFADADQVTAEAFGEISQTPASYEDWGQIVADVRYGKLSTKATSVNAQNKAYDKFIRDYVGETAQLVKQSGLSERNTFAWEGSGTITAQGQLGLGQAPQHTVFGEEGQFTFNGSAEESFTPKGIEGTGLIVKGSAAQNLSLAKESVVQNCSSQDLQKDSNLLTSHQQQVQHIPSVVLHPISHSYPITMVQNSSLLVVRSLRTSLLIGDRLFKEMELLLLLITVRSLRLQFQKISTMDLYVWLPSGQRITSTLFLDSSPSRFLGNPRKHTPDLLISVLEHTSSPTLQMLQEHTTTNLLVLLVLPLTRRHQHLRCKLVQSGTTTYSIRS